MKKHIGILLALCAFVTFLWFHNMRIIGGGEEGLPFYNPVRTLELDASAWRDTTPGHLSVGDVNRVPFFAIVSFFYVLGVPNYVLEAGMFFILMTVGCASVYFLLYLSLDDVIEKKWVFLLGAVFYLLNPYAMSQIWGRGLLAQYFPFALFPCFLLLFILGLQEKKYIYGLLLLFISFVFAPAFGNPSYIVSLWFVVFLYLICYCISRRGSKKDIWFAVRFFLFVFIFWVGTNLWWLSMFPVLLHDLTAYNGIGDTQGNINDLLAASSSAPFFSVIRLIQNFYFFTSRYYGTMYSSPLFQIISFFVPIITLFSIKSLRKNYLLTFFAILFGIGLCMCLGSNRPFGIVFVWIFTHIPFFSLYRNPYEKFGIVYVLSYTVFFTVGLSVFFDMLTKKIRLLLIPKVQVISVCFFLFFSFILYLWPFWTARIFTNGTIEVGVTVPSYYRDLQMWLDVNNKKNYRVFFPPVLSGEALSYTWGSTRYLGIDPMLDLLRNSTISQTPSIPFVFDMLISLRNQVGSMDITPVLSLFRAKYLVTRDDVVNISLAEKMHAQYVLNSYVTPSTQADTLPTICGNTPVDPDSEGNERLVCSVPQKLSNWSSLQYLRIQVATDVPAAIELAIQDGKGNRPRWDGRVNTTYVAKNDWTEIFIPLGSPTEYSAAIEMNHIQTLELYTHPLDSTKHVSRLQIRGIYLDAGNKVAIDDFQSIRQFGKLHLYTMKKYTGPKEFGLFGKLQLAKSFSDLFTEASQNSFQLDNIGFIIPLENRGKNIVRAVGNSQAKVLKQEKISDTAYYIRIHNPDKNAYLYLSKSFNDNWKVIPNVNANFMRRDPWNKIYLLYATPLTEKNHFVVNGYANVWKLDKKGDVDYVIVFLPQILLEFTWFISLSTIGVIGILLIILILRTQRNKYDISN